MTLRTAALAAIVVALIFVACGGSASDAGRSSRPIRTAPEVAEAVRSSLGDWCEESQIQYETAVGSVIKGDPKWHDDRAVWTITCVIEFVSADPAESWMSQACQIVDDRTLELTSKLIEIEETAAGVSC